MSTYDLYLLGHLGAAAAWLGCGLAIALLATRVSLSGDPARRAQLARDAEWFGLRVFLPASVLTLVFGVLLVEKADWGFGTLWVDLGFAAVAVSTVLGAGALGPGWKRVADAALRRDASSVRTTLGVLVLVGWLDLGVVAAGLVVMVAKPNGDNTGGLLAGGLVLLAAAAIGALARARSLALPTVPREAEAGGAAGSRH